MTVLLSASQVAIAGRLIPTDVDFLIGQMVALIGPNGGGKTSLLRSLARVEGALGTVLLDGEGLDQLGINRRRQLLSFLPATHDVVWPVPVRDYVSLSGASSDAVHNWLDAFELHRFADRGIDSLSTGERSRAMLARALSTSPRLLLLDEPLSNLDPYWVLRTLEILRGEAQRGAGVIVSLHDLGQLGAFDRVLMVGAGAVVADGPPEETIASPSFEHLFHVTRTNGSFAITPLAGRQSSP